MTKAGRSGLVDARGAVVGVEYAKDGAMHKEYGPVIIATGGFGADYTPDSLLAKHRPELRGVPDEWGSLHRGRDQDGAERGAGVVDMTSVQVHPTGLVNPNEPDAKVKFLAAEALRGVGGILLDANGERFCDELGRRDSSRAR